MTLHRCMVDICGDKKLDLLRIFTLITMRATQHAASISNMPRRELPLSEMPGFGTTLLALRVSAMLAQISGSYAKAFIDSAVSGLRQPGCNSSGF